MYQLEIKIRWSKHEPPPLKGLSVTYEISRFFSCPKIIRHEIYGLIYDASFNMITRYLVRGSFMHKYIHKFSTCWLIEKYCSLLRLCYVKINSGHIKRQIPYKQLKKKTIQKYYHLKKSHYKYKSNR